MTGCLSIYAGRDNVYRDLGFPEAEAQNLLLRTDPAALIHKLIDNLGVTQSGATKRAASPSLAGMIR